MEDGEEKGQKGEEKEQEEQEGLCADLMRQDLLTISIATPQTNGTDRSCNTLLFSNEVTRAVSCESLTNRSIVHALSRSGDRGGRGDANRGRKELRKKKKKMMKRERERK